MHPNEHLFCQNQRDLRAYNAALERGELPVERGLVVRDFQVELSEARGRGWPG